MNPKVIRQRAITLRNEASPPEKILWFQLRKRHLDGYKFRRQHPIDNFIVDFVCLEQKLIIELDGGQHNTDQSESYDGLRTRELEKKGFRVIRFWNHEVMNRLGDVLDVISAALR